jgi:ABC-2 type transport system permease protein
MELVMLTLLRILNLAWKELLTMVKDPRARLNLIVPPLIQCIIFGYAATYDLRSVNYVVIDQDRSSASRQLVSGLVGSGAFVQIADDPSISGVDKKIDRRDALMVVQIPADFERRLLRGQNAEVQLLVDGRNSNTAGSAVNYATSIVSNFNAAWKQQHPSDAPSRPEIRVVDRAWYNPNLDTRWNMVPGLLAMLTLLDVTLLASLSVAREREQGTLDQLLVTPMGPIEVLFGKAFPTIIVGLIQATVVLLVTLYWFEIPFAGSYLTLYAALLLFLCAAVGVGLFVSAMCSTMQQAMLGSFVVLMPFALLSGLSTPISSMPQWVQYFTLINPLRWGTATIHRIFLEGNTFAQVFPLMIPLILIAIVAFLSAGWMFRHKLA